MSDNGRNHAAATEPPGVDGSNGARYESEATARFAAVAEELRIRAEWYDRVRKLVILLAAALLQAESLIEGTVQSFAGGTTGLV